MLRVMRTALVLLALACYVSAGLFGTLPVASTVWGAGRTETISWTDDSSKPRLKNMKSIDVELFAGDDERIATLAKGVDPTAKTLSVWVSPSWGHNGTDYYIRFVSHDPSAEVYTATFTILDMSTMSALTPGPDASAATTAAPSSSQITTAPSSALYTPYLTFVLPDTTVVSALSPRPSSTRAFPMGTPVAPLPPAPTQTQAGMRAETQKQKPMQCINVYPTLRSCQDGVGMLRDRWTSVLTPGPHLRNTSCFQSSAVTHDANA